MKIPAIANGRICVGLDEKKICLYVERTLEKTQTPETVHVDWNAFDFFEVIISLDTKENIQRG